MNKKLKFLTIAIFAAIGLFQPAAAQETAQPVTMISRSTGTSEAITISHNSVTTVVDNSSQTYRYAYVENEDTSASLFCNYKTNVATSGAARGERIRPGKWKAWTLLYNQSLYCKCDGASACAAYRKRAK